jgi:hypothetical protein
MFVNESHQDVDSIIQFSDDATKEMAGRHYWSRLEKSLPDSVDYEALRICVRLLPPFSAVNDVSAHSVVIAEMPLIALNSL